MPATTSKYARLKAKPRTGTFDVDGSFRHVLKLDWIPVAKKSRARAALVKGRIIFLPDRAVEMDTAAIRAIVGNRPPLASLGFVYVLWRLVVTVHRPLTKAEQKRGTWNTRRGDTVSSHELVCDALNGLWWNDDSQIVDCRIVEKRDVEVPGMLVEGFPL